MLFRSQEKTALLWHQNQWCRPRGSTPTTHLFKLPMGRVGSGQIDFSSSVENEWLCGRILAAYGLPMAASRLASFDGQRCLIVERFDRRPHPGGNHWLRLPVEDFCQATGTPPEQKYDNQGGPGMVAIAICSPNPSVQQRICAASSRPRCCAGCCGRSTPTPRTSASSCCLAAATGSPRCTTCSWHGR